MGRPNPGVKRRVELGLVLDGGYDVPGGYTGRVVTGMGPGPNLVTRVKPLPVRTRDPYIYDGFYPNRKINKMP